MGSGCIQNDSTLRIGVTQIQHTGVNKLGDGKEFGCTVHIHALDN